jgi:EAL domain-containing protein (putative c-di-GMP-specific phosphodiesterase class I)
MATVLLVDDDHAVRRAYSVTLEKAGHIVEKAGDGEEALERLRSGSFDVIVSDISMPRMGGLQFLRAVRERDLDVPVVLMTGGPELESAVHAVEYGALRYFTKPVEPAELLEAVRRAAALHGVAKLKRQALELLGADAKWMGDRATLEVHFESALRSLWLAFQPIVSWRERRVFGYEALVRSAEPALSRPDVLLEAAERLHHLPDLGRAIRARAAAAAASAPDGATLFVNLHAADLEDEELYAASSPLSQVADRVVLEITERASLDGLTDTRGRVASLRRMGYRIAVDDLGAGYAGLSSFALLDPEVAKLDMSIVRGVDTDTKKQSIVRSMAKLCGELGVLAITEGVETPAERSTLSELGCDLLQGYLFARPDRAFPSPQW